MLAISQTNDFIFQNIYNEGHGLGVLGKGGRTLDFEGKVLQTPPQYGKDELLHFEI
jgi:hypothetical protein